MKNTKTIGRIIAAIGLVLAAISLAMPCLSVGVKGMVSMEGTLFDVVSGEEQYLIYVAIIALVIALIGIALGKKWLTIIGAAAMALFLIMFYSEVHDEPVRMSFEMGYYLYLVGTLAVFGGGLMI